jgi:hypothetical protein
MLNTKADAKNIQLLKMLAQLRDHIDMHRIIGLNVKELQEGHISEALLGYLQKSAHESLALYISKIFEASSRNDLNWIPGIIESLPTTPVTEMQVRQLAAFGSKYGHEAIPADARSYLRDTLVRFRDAHSEPSAASMSFATRSAPIVTTARTSHLSRRTLSSRPCSVSPRTSTKLIGLHYRERTCRDPTSGQPWIR